MQEETQNKSSLDIKFSTDAGINGPEHMKPQDVLSMNITFSELPLQYRSDFSLSHKL